MNISKKTLKNKSYSPLVNKKLNVKSIKTIKNKKLNLCNNLLKLKFINSIPCNVTKIFQIQINENKNKDEIKQ